jgi:hypothetical protein
MPERARQLHATADRQIAELLSLISALDEATLRLPCASREKLGDGTVAACARHTADNYQRIATFVQTSDRTAGGYEPSQHSSHRTPRPLRNLGHASADHAGPGQYTADNMDLSAVVKQLTASRNTLARVGALTDNQLDIIPPNGSFRLCDGRRTLEQVLASLLKHQGHQVDALKTALA